MAASRRRREFEQIIALADGDPVRCVDPLISRKMITEIKKAARGKDTLGGVFEVLVSGLPAGLGSNAQWYHRLDAQLAAALMSIPSVKGVEVGDGFASARRRGSQVHDRIIYRKGVAGARSKGFFRTTNRSGGCEGGLSTGADLVVRAACKPLSTLMEPLGTVDIKTKRPAAAIVERSDICVVPAAGIVGEAMAAMVIASALTDKFGGDSRTEIEAHLQAFDTREF
jgi:chorismate synthase